MIEEGGYTAKDVAMFVAENTPGVGEAILAKDIATDVSKGIMLVPHWEQQHWVSVFFPVGIF